MRRGSISKARGISPLPTRRDLFASDRAAQAALDPRSQTNSRITEPPDTRQEGLDAMTFTKENSEKARSANAFGRARQRETREKNIHEVAKLTSELLGGLGRQAVGGEI